MGHAGPGPSNALRIEGRSVDAELVTSPKPPAAGSLPLWVAYSPRRINRLAVGLGATTYLEIGIEAGDTFRAVGVRERVGVDPVIAPDIAAIANEATRLHALTSDAFFASLSVDRTFDVIFIDGLHTFEQTYRDLSNALLHSHSRTVILIDDTRPNDVFSTIRDQHKAYAFRSTTGNTDRSWHGDTFKVVFALHDFHPGLDYRTIVDNGNPQTLVWRSANAGRKPIFDSFERISRLTYFDMVEAEEVLRLTSEDAAIDQAISTLGRSDR
jgi:hypothetical protein